jgi:hypothetical protein
MRTITHLGLAALVVVAAAACSGAPSDGATDEPSSPSTSTIASAAPVASTAPTGDADVAGITKVVPADAIAAILGDTPAPV